MALHRSKTTTLSCLLLILILFAPHSIRSTHAMGIRPPDSEKVTRITYWTGWMGHEMKKQEELVDRFNALHPHIQVRIVTLAGVYQKVRIAFAGGDTPDLLSSCWAREIAGYAIRGVLTPLDSFFERDRPTLPDEYFPGIWRSFQFEGQTMALAVTTNAQFFYYNKDVFREVGLDPEWTPRTLDELMETIDRCTIVDNRGNYIRYGYRPANLEWWAYIFGGKWYDQATLTVTADHPRNIAALQFLQNFAQQYDIRKMQTFESSLGNVFSAQNPLYVGKVAMRVSGEWEVQKINRYSPDLDYGFFAAPPPPGGRENCVTFDGSVFVIPAASQHKEEAWTFLNWLTQPEQVKEFCLALYNLPPLKALMEEPEFRDHPVFNFAGELMAGENVFGPPNMPVWSRYLEEIQRSEDRCVFHGADPEAELQRVRQVVQNELDLLLKQRGHLNE